MILPHKVMLKVSTIGLDGLNRKYIQLLVLVVGISKSFEYKISFQ